MLALLLMLLMLVQDVWTEEDVARQKETLKCGPGTRNLV